MMRGVRDEHSAESTDGYNGAPYASFFHHHPHATYSIDRNGYYTDANHLALEMTGLTLEQMKETHFSHVIHPDDLHLVQDGFERAQWGETSLIEARVSRPDGEVVDIRVTAIPILLDGEFVGVHGVTEDTTKAKQILRQLVDANARLEEANAQLEEANHAKTLFIANVSHELRTPLSAIIAATEIMLDTQPEPASEHFVRMVQRNGERLYHLVNDVLDFSGLAAHRVSLRRRPFDLRGLIEGIADWAVPLASNRHLELSIDVEGSVPARLVGDALRVEQMLGNLVQNAIKFTDTGGVDVHVGARTAAAAGHDTDLDMWVEFTITDTGIGIPEDRLSALFEPFTQADPSSTRTHQGVGLGLAICRDLVDLLGGQLRTTSTVGEGTTFIVGVPMGRVAGEPRGHTRAPPP